MQQSMFDIQPSAAPSFGMIPDAEIRVPIPGWLPEEVKEKLRLRVGKPYTVTLTRAEKKIFRKRKKLKVSEWAEKHRVLTMSSISGPWRNEVTPYLTGIMDAAQHPSVRGISVCKCPQSGVTEAVHNFVGSCIDQDPGPVLYVFPDREMAEENSRDRILPMIRSSRRLKRYMTGTKSDESMLRINLAHMPIYMAWASSPSRLGNKPIRYGIGDEVDKWCARGSKEAGPSELIDKRFTTYRDVSKFFKISTPTVESGIIWKSITEECDVVFHYWVRCPSCGADQLMRFKQIKFLDGCRDPKIMRKNDLARYECEHCKAHWNDHLRNKAVAMGQWRAQADGEPIGLELFTYLDMFDPQYIGFLLPAWVTRFNTLAYCAAAFLESLSGDLEKKKNFATQIEALPYKKIINDPVNVESKAAMCELPQQTVPEKAVALTCGIDCQKVGFYFLVRAWARDYTSWMIHYGKLATWEDVGQLLFGTSYPVDGSNRRMGIARAAVDTGGSQFADESMTEQAYWWLRKNGVGRGARCWGTRGASWPQANKIKVSKPIDKTPSGKPIPGGLQILTMDTEKLKDAFFYRLEQASRAEPELCAWLHRETGDDYFSHITAEHKVENEKGIMQWVKKGSRRNDWLDCEIMAAACADPEWPEGGIHLIVPFGVEAPGIDGKTRRAEEGGEGGRRREVSSERYELPGWIREY